MVLVESSPGTSSPSLKIGGSRKRKQDVASLTHPTAAEEEEEEETPISQLVRKRRARLPIPEEELALYIVEIPDSPSRETVQEPHQDTEPLSSSIEEEGDMAISIIEPIASHPLKRFPSKLS